MNWQDNTLPDLFEAGRARIENTVGTFQRDFARFQKQADKRRREFGQRIGKMQAEFEETPVGQHIKGIRLAADQNARERVNTLLENLPVARSSELGKLERKVERLNRKVRALEKSKAKRAGRLTPARPA